MFRASILNQHLIFLRSLKEPFGGNSVEITDCRASSLPGVKAGTIYHFFILRDC